MKIRTKHRLSRATSHLRRTAMLIGLMAAAAGASQADAQQIIKFDAPNSGTAAGAGTYPTSINELAVITGNVTDDNYGTHGFVGTPAFGFTDFDAPGADPVVGGTFPLGINDFLAVAGYDTDSNSVSHGFLRTPEGLIGLFDVSQAGTGAGQGTFSLTINDLGEIAGFYVDGSNAAHGFVRAPGGRITTFDVPAGVGSTYPSSINNFGVIAGTYFDTTNGVGHGFVRTASGQITSFDPPHSVSGPASFGTGSAYINDLGVIGGSYFDASSHVEYGYVRYPDGRFAEFAAPGAGTIVSSSDQSGTLVNALNLEGSTTGLILDNNFEAHAFVRFANGKAVTFDVPGQAQIPGIDAGSAGAGITALGIIAGHWRDSNLTYHGFLRIP